MIGLESSHVTIFLSLDTHNTSRCNTVFDNTPHPNGWCKTVERFAPALSENWSDAGHQSQFISDGAIVNYGLGQQGMSFVAGKELVLVGKDFKGIFLVKMVSSF